LSEGIWLLFPDTTKEEQLEDVNVPFNSLVLVATQTGQTQFLLEEVYRVAPHLPLVTRRVGTWDSAAGGLTWARETTRTYDLRGVTIKAAMTHVSSSSLTASLSASVYHFKSTAPFISTPKSARPVYKQVFDFP
jgi:hypothetical protein